MKKVISYDFDGTLHSCVKGKHPVSFINHLLWIPRMSIIEQMLSDAEDAQIVIVTARDGHAWERRDIQKFIRMWDLPVSEIHYTGGPKRALLERLGASVHWDDNRDMVREMRGSSCKLELVEPEDPADQLLSYHRLVRLAQLHNQTVPDISVLINA